MKHSLCLIIALLLLISLTSCAPESQDPTAAPTTETTEAPTTGPSNPPAPDTPWLTAARDHLPYEEYFSTVRIFSYIAGPYSTIWNVNADGNPGILYSGTPTANAYCLKPDQHGLHILSYGTQKTVWTVPDSQNLTSAARFITDGRYAYCIRDRKELLRVELLTGKREILATADRFPVESDYCLSLHDREVLLYLTQTDDKISVNRLYLPTMTPDVLCDNIPAEAFLCYFTLSYNDTDALLWCIMDPAFIPKITDILSDQDSDYRQYVTNPDSLWSAENLDEIAVHPNFTTLVQHIEILEETPALLSCYLELSGKTFEEEPSYWCPDMQESRGYQDVSHWAQLYMRFSDPAAEPVTNQELTAAFDRSPFSFIKTLSENGPWNDSREAIVRQLIAAKADDLDNFIEILHNELTYYRTAAAKAQPVAMLTRQILDESLGQFGIE